MANVKFLAGEISSLPSSLSEGSVYFAITDNIGKRGKIIFDKDSLNRYIMSSTPAETIAFGICETDCLSTEKIIKLSNNNEWQPVIGSSLFVKFTQTNAMGSPVFSIFYENGTKILENIPIYYNNQIITNSGVNRAGFANCIVHYIYDGSAFWFLGWTQGNDYIIASNSDIGLIKPWYYHSVASFGPISGSDEVSIQVNEISSIPGRYYAIEMDSEGHAFVNVPWEKPLEAIKNPCALTIGPYVYDGSESVTIPIYDGEEMIV